MALVESPTDLDLEALSKLEARATKHPVRLNRYDIDSGIISWQLQFEPPSQPGEVLTQGSDEHNPRSRYDHELMAALWNNSAALLEKAKRLETLDSLMSWAASPGRQVWCGDTDSWYAMRGQDFFSGETPAELARLLGIEPALGWSPKGQGE